MYRSQIECSVFLIFYYFCCDNFSSLFSILFIQINAMSHDSIYS